MAIQTRSDNSGYNNNSPQTQNDFMRVKVEENECELKLGRPI